MKDAWSSTDQSHLRTYPQGATWYVAVHVPASLTKFLVSATPATHPVSAVDITVHEGTSTLGKKHMTLWVGSTPGGSEKGRARLRRDSDWHATKIAIAEAGSGLISWTSPTYLTVMEQVLPWSIHPRYNTDASQWRLDYDEVHVTQLQDYGAYPNMGPPFIGFLDEKAAASETSGSATHASFVGNRSFAWDSDVFSAAWVFPDGQTDVNLGAPSAPVTKTFSNEYSQGRYYYLDVVSGNGASRRGYRPMWTFADRTGPQRVMFSEVIGDIPSNGYRTQITVFPDTSGSGAEQGKWPDLSEVVIFEEASYGDVGSNIGGNYPFRSNVVFRGWLLSETQRISPVTGDVTFEAVGIHSLMAKLDAYDLFLANAASPLPGASHWVEAANLSLDRAAFHLLTDRSTVSRITDFYPASGLAITENPEYQSLPRTNLWAQLKQNYGTRGWLGHIAADMQSSIYAFEDTQITGGSGNIANNGAITYGDRRDIITINRPQFNRSSHVRLDAVTGTTPLGAESPGNVAGYYGVRTEITRGLLVDSQDTLITWAGNKRAAMNNEYPSVVVPLQGNKRWDCIPLSMGTMSLSAVDNTRGISWSNKDFLINKTRLQYDGVAGYVNTEIGMEAVVNGIGGSAITFPRIDDIVYLDPEPPDSNPDPPDGGSGTFGDGFGTAFHATDVKLGRTLDLSADSPAWVDITPAGVTDVYDFILDPWAPSTTAYLTTDLGVHKTTNVKDATPTWSLVFDANDASFTWGAPWKIVGSINVQDYIVFAYQDGANARVTVSQDGGASWTQKAGPVFGGGNAKDWRGALDVLPHLLSGNVAIYVTVGDSRDGVLYRSTNHGTSWTQLIHGFTENSIFDPVKHMMLHVPYDDNSNGNVAYGSHVDQGGTVNMDADGTTDGSTTFDITAGLTARLEGTWVKRTGIETYTQDRQIMYWWQHDDPGTGTARLFKSTDAGATWAEQSHTGFTGAVWASGGFPNNSSQFYIAGESGIFVSTDGGATWTDKSGDFTSSVGSFISDSVNNVGRGVIVPIWTE